MAHRQNQTEKSLSQEHLDDGQVLRELGIFGIEPWQCVFPVLEISLKISII